MITYIVNGVRVDPNGKPVQTPLPDDFPMRKTLVAAGLETVEAVKAVPDLVAVKGIGETNAPKVLEALTALGA